MRESSRTMRRVLLSPKRSFSRLPKKEREETESKAELSEVLTPLKLKNKVVQYTKDESNNLLTIKKCLPYLYLILFILGQI
jgi:hypothetical protein